MGVTTSHGVTSGHGVSKTHGVTIRHGVSFPYSTGSSPVIPADFVYATPTTTYDFSGGTLDPRLTFTRASTGWYFGTDGLLKSAANDVPRFGTGGPGNTSIIGLLIEEARTNYCTYSDDLTQWTASTMTVTKDQADLAGNANSCCTLTATAGNATVTLGALANSGTGRVSLYLQRVSGSGSIQVSTNGGTGYTTQAITTTLTRYNFSCTTGATIIIRIVTSGNSIIVKQVQCETTSGSDPSSPIPTNGVAVTRAIDVCADTNWSVYHNNTAGTLQVECQRLNSNSASVSYVVSIDKGATTSNISCTQSSTLPAAAITNTTTYNANGVLALAAGVTGKIAVSYITAASRAYYNGTELLTSTQFDAVPATDISNATVVTGMTVLRVGNRFAGDRCYNGFIRTINYYSGDLPQMQKVATTYANGSGTVSGTVTADLTSLSNTIDPDFVGWSAETADVIADGFGYSIYTTANTSFQGVAALLGSHGKLRIGGNSQDVNPAPALTAPIATDIAGFLAGVGANWRLVYGLDIPVQDSALAVTQAGYILGAFSGTVEFSLGNEPTLTDHYPNGYATDWTPYYDSYYTALKAAYPSILIEGPEDDSTLTTQNIVNSTTTKVAGMSSVSSHFYAQGDTPTPTITQVLAQVGAQDWSINVSFASGTTYGLNLNECNINSKGGTKGITDRAIAATWFCQLAPTLATAGWKGVCQHNVLVAGSSTSYSHIGYYNAFTNLTPGGTTWYATPIFYGMYLFSKMAGQQIATANKTGLNSAVTAFATLRSSGKANILITNADQFNYATVIPAQSSPWSTANVLLVQGTSLTDNAITMNGGTIAASGASVPAATVINNGDGIQLAPGGVALIQIN